MSISLSDLKYLDNKHRGGVNNSKGIAYEHLYAIYRISTLLLLHKENLQNIIIKSQIRAFIDDLYIKEISHISYYQIKNVLNLSWNYGSNCHTLKNDCILQNELSNSESEDFSIIIVYSDLNFAIKTIPNEISSYTSIEFFPYCDSVNQLLFEYEPFRQSIKDICSLDDPKNDELSNIAQVLLGIWCSMDLQEVCLKDFYNIVIKHESLPIKGFQKISISNECKSLFETFSIDYKIVENKLIWNYKNQIQGRIIWSEQKDRSLACSSINNRWDLIKLLN